MKRPYFILPFDHRNNFAKELFNTAYPFAEEFVQPMIETREIIFDAILEAVHEAPEIKQHVGVLTDYQFGRAVLERAKRSGLTTILTTEASGTETFTFQDGDHFQDALIEFVPAYAKVLVRYDVREKEKNRQQREKILSLSRFCENHHMRFLIEPLVLGNDRKVDDVVTCIREMQEDGIKANIWKIEGLDAEEDWAQVQKVTSADVVVLGRGESAEAVEKWLTDAKRSGVADGFAVGRTVFLDALKRYFAKEISREEAVQQIAKRFMSFVEIWKKA